MSDITDLIARLRPVNQPVPLIYSEAADALEAQARECEELRGDIAEFRIDLANALCREEVAKSRLAAAERERDEAVALLVEIRDATASDPWAEAWGKRADAFLAKLEERK